MKLPLVLDMNISPSWCAGLRAQGLEVSHWSDIGAHGAADEIIMEYARLHKAAIITYDFDFANLLALTHVRGPSVILLRKQYAIPPEETIQKLAQAIRGHEALLSAGALMVVDPVKSRIRTLPLLYDAD